MKQEKPTRIMILAFDGLEYKLVNKFGLKNLKQKEYGKVKIPKECFVKVKSHHFNKYHVEPWTPLVWYAFLTGRPPENRTFYSVWDNKFLNILRRVTIKLKLGKIKGKGEILRKAGFQKRYLQKKDYKVPTIFDSAEKSVAINAPVYSKEWTLILGADPSQFKDFNDFISLVLMKEWLYFNKLKNRVLKTLEENRSWDLFMVYFKLLDIYGELSWGNKPKLRKAYLSVDDFAGKVKEKINNCLVLIVSDHGIEQADTSRFGKHSSYGFYSLNIPLKLGNPKITDFHSLIRSILKKNEIDQSARDRELKERKQVEDRLRSLGYI